MDENDSSSSSDEISDSEIDSLLLDKDLVESALAAAPQQEFLYNPQTMNESAVLPDFACLDVETQERLQAMLQAAGITRLSSDGRVFGDPELLRKLTSSVSNALDEAAAALSRLKNDEMNVENLDDSTANVIAEITAGNASVEDGESLLSLACSAGYYELAQVLLAMRTNVEDRGSKGDCTPLMEAASAGHADIVKLLISHGADMNAQSTNIPGSQSSGGNTALMYACAGGHVDVVRVLLKAGANVLLCNSNGHTPLMEAASAGHLQITQLLVSNGAYDHREFKTGLDSPLTMASYKGHTETVRYLLKLDIEHLIPGFDEELHTALMEACIDGHVEVAKLLFEAGAQVNLNTDSFESPLTLAACGGHTDLALLLLEHGANVEEPNDDGYTPLMEACRDGHEELVELLLEWGACVNATTEDTGETALTLACAGGHKEVVELLLDRGADIEPCTNSPLLDMASEGRIGMVRFLLRCGASVDKPNPVGETALTLAAEQGHTDVCVLLLEWGADINYRASADGQTALMKACRAGHYYTVQFLMSKGADPEITTIGNEHCALSLACLGGHLSIVELLLRHGVDINKKLKDGNTVIMEAAKGGHTSVMHLLLDWPNVSIAMPADLPSRAQSQHQPPVDNVPPPPPPVSLPSCAEMSTAARLLDQNPISSHVSVSNLLPAQAYPVSSNPYYAASPVVDTVPLPNLLPQFCLPSTSQDQSLMQSPPDRLCIVSQPTMNLQITSASMHPSFLSSNGQTTSLPDLVSSVADFGSNSTQMYKHTPVDRKKDSIPSSLILSQTEKALLKQASEKLTLAELQHLQELLKAQFQQTASQLACRTGRVPPLLTDAAQLDQTTITSNSPSRLAKNISIEALTDASLCMRQWYEEVQKVLEQKDVKVKNKALKATTTAYTGKNSKTNAYRVNSNLSRDTDKIPQLSNEQSNSSSVSQSKPSCAFTDKAILTSSNVTSSAPVLLPAADLGQVTTLQQQLMSFQFLSSLSPSQLQFLQQQFNLAALSHHCHAQQLQNSNNSGQQFMNHMSVTTSSAASDLNSVAATAAAFSTFCQQATANLAAIHHPSMTVLRNQCDIDQIAIDNNHEISSYFEPVPVHIVANSQQASMVDCGHSIVDSKDKSLSSDSGVNLFNQQTTPTPFSFPLTTGFNFKLPYASTMSEPNLGYISSSTSTATAMQPHMTFPTVPTAVPFSQPMTNGDLVPSPPFTLTTCQSNHSSLNNVKATQTSLPEETTVNNNSTIDAKIKQEFCDQRKTQSQGIDLNTQTESNHDTALTLACAGGHAELVTLLLNRGANIEHQDKKGFTPLILASTAGHLNVVELLLQYGANPEAQSERTKDTALSLACSSGKKEVIELLLKKGVNKEHRNVSDYTPLSLAASGGYTDIISLLLQYGAEINSRTGSKLGISPLMLASMNGHVQAVKLLLEKSADINAQIETNRNTALTLACFQGRHEVVRLLLQYGANVEHRAKTGLTPLMEAASGGYVDVGRVLLEYGADPNSSPVPSSRDTALTIAAEKGHAKFVELLLQNHAQLDCKTKKGCSALWLASHGGFLEIVQALVKVGACPDAQDNRRVTPLMAAFRKCHFKVVKYLVRHVQQFPSDTDCTRYMTTITDKDILARCKQCMDIIMTAKDRQAQEANKAAAVLLQELEQEQQLAETRRQAKIRQKEKKKAKRKAKKAATSGFSAKQDGDEDASDNEQVEERTDIKQNIEQPPNPNKEKSGSSSRSTSSRSSPGASVERNEPKDANDKLKNSLKISVGNSSIYDKSQERVPSFATALDVLDEVAPPPVDKDSKHAPVIPTEISLENRRRRRQGRSRPSETNGIVIASRSQRSIIADTLAPKGTPKVNVVTKRMPANESVSRKENSVHSKRDPARADSLPNSTELWSKNAANRSNSSQVVQSSLQSKHANATSRSNNVRTVINSARIAAASSAFPPSAPVPLLNFRSQADENIPAWRESKRHPQKIYVSCNSIARVIGRGGNNINAIRESSGAHIEVEKQQKGQTDRMITIKGSVDAIRQAILMINGLINDPDVPVQEIVAKVKSKDSKALEFYGRSSANLSFRHLNEVYSKNESQTKATSSAAKLIDSLWLSKDDIKIHCSSTDIHVLTSKINTKSTTSKNANISTIPTYTTASNTVKVSTSTVSNVKQKAGASIASDYSPFSTPNVWFSRAAAAAAAAAANTLGTDGSNSSNHPIKLMNFASVAAANLSIAVTNSVTNQSGSSAPIDHENLCENNAKHRTVPHNSTDTIIKAPGYRSAKSNSSIIEAQSGSEANFEPIFPINNISHGVVQLNDGDWTAKLEGKLSAVDLLSDLPVPTNTPLSPPHESLNLVSHAADTLPTSNSSIVDKAAEGNDVEDPTSTLTFLSPEEQSLPNNATTNLLNQHATFDIEGRRSAGASFSSYFSPVPPPRPASALENFKSAGSYTNAADVRLQYNINNADFTPTSSSQVTKETQSVLQLSPKDYQNFNLAMSNLLLPTPIGGERRSKTNVNEFPASIFDQQSFQQQIPQRWDAEKNWVSNISSNMPNSFHDVNKTLNTVKQPDSFVNYNGPAVNGDFSLPSDVDATLTEGSAANANPPNKEFPVNSNDFWINNQIKSLGNYQLLQNCLNNPPNETYINNFFGSSASCDAQQQNVTSLLPQMPPASNFNAKMSLFGRNPATDPWSSNANGVSAIGSIHNPLSYCQPPPSQPWKFVNGGGAYYPSTAQTPFAPSQNQQHSIKDRPSSFAYCPPPPPPPTMNQPPPPPTQSQQFRSFQTVPQNPPPHQHGHGWSGMSLADQLKYLTNPAPSAFHPDEEDECDITRATLAEKCDETSEKFPRSAFGSIRQRSDLLLEEKDGRYRGTVTKRRVLTSDVEEFTDSDTNDDYFDSSPKARKCERSSDNDDIASQQSQDDVDESEDGTVEDMNGEELESADEREESGLVRTFAHVDISGEHSKARAVQNQLKMWEQLLAARIRLQRVVASVNLLPQSENCWNGFNESTNDSELSLHLQESKNRLKSVIDRLIHFQNRLWLKNDQTKPLASGQSATVVVDSDVEIPSSPEGSDLEEKSINGQPVARTSLKMSEYPQTLERRQSNFVNYRNKVLLHWFDKTKLASGRIGGKNDFSAFEKNVVQQIEQVLSDQARLIRRTQLKRSDYPILGKRKFGDCKADEEEANEEEYDEEIFDDDDFYHQLLREIVENKVSNETDPQSLGRQWLEVQKLRSKAKKKLVDRKASKARKIRYDVMPKLTNFMAPTNSNVWPDEASFLGNVIMDEKPLNDLKPCNAARRVDALKEATHNQSTSACTQSTTGGSGRKNKFASELISKLESYFFEHTLSNQPDWLKSLIEKYGKRTWIPIIEISKMDPHFPTTMCPALKVLLRKYGDESKVIEIDDKGCNVRQRYDSLDAIDCGLFIDNLPPEADEKWVKDALSNYGPILAVEIPKRIPHCKNGGICFVYFSRCDAVEKVVQYFDRQSRILAKFKKSSVKNQKESSTTVSSVDKVPSVEKVVEQPSPIVIDVDERISAIVGNDQKSQIVETSSLATEKLSSKRKLPTDKSSITATKAKRTRKRSKGINIDRKQVLRDPTTCNEFESVMDGQLEPKVLTYNEEKQSKSSSIESNLKPDKTGKSSGKRAKKSTGENESGTDEREAKRLHGMSIEIKKDDVACSSPKVESVTSESMSHAGDQACSGRREKTKRLHEKVDGDKNCARSKRKRRRSSSVTRRDAQNRKGRPIQSDDELISVPNNKRVKVDHHHRRHHHLHQQEPHSSTAPTLPAKKHRKKNFSRKRRYLKSRMQRRLALENLHVCAYREWLTTKQKYKRAQKTSFSELKSEFKNKRLMDVPKTARGKDKWLRKIEENVPQV